MMQLTPFSSDVLKYCISMHDIDVFLEVKYCKSFLSVLLLENMYGLKHLMECFSNMHALHCQDKWLMLYGAFILTRLDRAKYLMNLIKRYL